MTSTPGYFHRVPWPRTLLVPVVLLTTALQTVFLLSGCSVDRVAREQKLIAQGDHYFTQQKFAEALLTYGRALQLNPQLVGVHYKVAKCLLKLQNWASAFQELKLTTALDPGNLAAHLDLGELYLAGDDSAEAKEQAELILRANPDHLAGQILLSASDAKAGNLKQAFQEAEKAVQTAPNDSIVYLNLAAIQQLSSAFRDAEASLLKAQSLAPDSASPSMGLGKLYQAQKRWPQAEQSFRSAIACTPRDPNARAALANMFVAQGKLLSAEHVFEEIKTQLGSDPVAYRMLGDFYVGQGDTAKALIEFASLAKEHPLDVSVRKSYAELLVNAHRLELAEGLIDDILKNSNQDSDALVLKARILLETGKSADGAQILRQAVKSAPANAMGHFQLGMAELAQGNSNEAANEWRESVRINPNLAQAWIALGTDAVQRRDWNSLEPIGNQLKKIAPQGSAGYLFHATARINEGDSATAETDLLRLLEISPESPTAYAKLGQLRISQGRWQEAEKLYKEALLHDPNSLDAIFGVVELDFRRQRPAEGLQFIQMQIDRNPKSPSLYLLQGQSFVREQRLADAERSFARCVALDDHSLLGFIDLAEAQQALGDSNNALTSYQRALALAPKNPQLYTATGIIYEEQKDWRAAQIAYQHALAIQPDDALPANNLASLMLEHGGNVNVALTLAQAARRGLPHLPNSADTLGWAYFHNAAYSLAAPLLEAAVEGAPSNATYRYHLGLTYEKLNDARRARAELQKSIRLDPNAPSAQKAALALSLLAGD